MLIRRCRLEQRSPAQATSSWVTVIISPTRSSHAQISGGNSTRAIVSSRSILVSLRISARFTCCIPPEPICLWLRANRYCTQISNSGGLNLPGRKHNTVWVRSQAFPKVGIPGGIPGMRLYEIDFSGRAGSDSTGFQPPRRLASSLHVRQTCRCSSRPRGVRQRASGRLRGRILPFPAFLFVRLA